MTKPRRRQAGEGGISEYQTQAGTRYLIKFWVTNEDGTRRQKLQRGFLTRKEAARELRRVLPEAERPGGFVEPTKMTVGAWLDQWIEGLQLAPSTVSSYRKNVRLHLKPRLGASPLAGLTGARISTLYRELERTGRQDHRSGEPLSARTIRYVHTILKAALRDAVEQGLITVNPADKAKPPAARAAKAPDIHPWTGPQLHAFLGWSSCHAVAVHASAWHVLAYTGMRRGELLALRWRDLDLDKATVSVRRSVGVVKTKGEGERIVEGTTKSTKPRVIDIDTETMELFRRLRLDRAGLSLQLVRDDALIFADLDGAYLHPERFSRTFTEQLARCRKALGDDAMPTIRLHDLRHTHATLLLQAGVPVKVVSERLGHATVMITLEIYAHVMPGMQREAAATFAAMIGGAS
ncbi:tyrosine-type recombinase/integrase [Kribbella deserti]|uniref:Tyrosine-type recombinase/integrase n=1 Tax=Kribbella deserti TaxID=1926257 RepID=A0ABV6QHV6_9ACTN